MVADGLIAALNATDKGPSPLMAAIQADAFRVRQPLVLRLAVEQTGGTSLSRSGLLYTLGLPNAATVSAGLIVSFRLIDPAGGGLKAVGVVRCIARQSNIKKVAQYLQHDRERWSATQPYDLGDTVCDFRVSP